MACKIVLLYRALIVLGLACALLSGCGQGSAGSTAEAREQADGSIPQAVNDHYLENPDFFVFASTDDLPEGLDWQNGLDQEPFADPAAVQGVEVRSFTLAFPPTIRVVGPQSNHFLRGAYLDGNALSLVGRHPRTLEPIPSVAREWAIGEDGRTVYFRIDPDARFSDGVPVRAEHFFYLFYFMHSPHLQDPWYNDWYTKTYEKITAFDDLTIAITLAVAQPDPLLFASLRPVPGHFYGELTSSFAQDFQWKFEPTTGAYEILPQNIRRGRSITMSRVPDWWGNDKRFLAHTANAERISYTVIHDRNIAWERFLSGELDFFDVTAPEFWYDRLSGVSAVDRGLIRRFTFYNDIPRPTMGLYINTAKPLLDDRTIRRGIHYASNFDRVNSFYFRGDFQRLPNFSTGYGDFTNPNVQPRPFDIERARELFAEAGFNTQGSDGILRRADGRRLSFTLAVNDDPIRLAVAQILREEARKAGLELNIQGTEATTNFRVIMSKEHDIAFMGWGVGGFFPRYWEHFHSVNANQPNTNNVTNLVNEELDRLTDLYEKETDLDEKRRLAHRLQEIIHEEAVFVPGYMTPFYRLAAWRWIQFPEFFDVPRSSGPQDFKLYWIDREKLIETMRMRRSGPSFPNEPLIFQ